MKINIKYLYAVFTILISSCKLEQINPNNATDQQVLTNRDGIIALSIGLRQYYSTTGLSNTLLIPSVTSREVKGVATFTNTLELEAGGTALPTANANLLNYWSAMQREMSMCESVIANAPAISTLEPGLLSGIMAQAYLFKAISLAELAMAFEQANISTSTTTAVNFVPRAQVFTEAIRLLDLGIAALNTTAASTTFTTLVSGTDFDLKNTLYAYNARINLMAGNYQKALDNANLVDLAKTSRFTYTTLSANPLYTIFQVTKSYRPRVNFGLPTGLYEANDQRLNFYFSAPNAAVNGDAVTSLTGFSATQTTAIPLYLTDEIRLIKAEATLRLNGSLTDALALINTVRTQTSGDPFGVNAGLPAYSGAVTNAALLLEVYKQRCAELYLSGLKWEDTRRFNRPAPPADVSERNRIFYPFPDQERLSNPNTPADPTI
ncbi:MAG: RagB/SusD family nutrient uptake outer membrane protein [Sphingobacteriaceae bacterium]|nr:MAG: RagB/SusD family nutrient uptake outer membrane protein [Sphingobacteriaceae bacterium]